MEDLLFEIGNFKLVKMELIGPLCLITKMTKAWTIPDQLVCSIVRYCCLNFRLRITISRILYFWFLGTWHLTPPEEEKQGWRHIRLQQSGKNASGQTHYLSLSGLELYGSVIGVCDELGKAAKEAEQQLRRQRRLMRTHVLKHLVIGTF